MKILGLYMENFRAIDAGLNKRVVDLDFEAVQNIINVFIGDMGSCKTFILSHLQPFGTLGNIDNRNNIDPIMERLNGKKVIRYLLHGDRYVLRHEYIWVIDRHTMKSYFTKNNEELNQNGNQSSFKDLVEIEFGIDMSCLTLIRLGNNVRNIIDYNASQRKTFIANMLEEVEFYNILNKILKDDVKQCNSVLNILGEKLNSLSSDREEDFKEALIKHSNNLIVLDKEKEINQIQYQQLIAEINTILKGSSTNDYTTLLNSYKDNYNQRKELFEDNKLELINITSNYNLTDIASKISINTSLISKYKEDIDRSDYEYQNVKKELDRMNELKLSIGNEDRINQLRKTYDELMFNMKDYEVSLKDFQCEYSAISIKSIIEGISSFVSLVSNIRDYNAKMITEIYNSDSSVLAYARKREENITVKKIILQKSINNIKYADKYETISTLFTPPFCPTEDCPYKKTHPYTLQSETTDKDRFKALQSIQDDIMVLDVELAKYMDYPIVYNRINVIKNQWKELKPKMQSLGILMNKDLKFIVTDKINQTWYNYNKLINILELCEKREKYYELAEKTNSMKAELNSLTKYDIDSITERISFYKEQQSKIVEDITNKESEIRNLQVDLDKYNDMYEKLNKIEMLRINVVNEEKDLLELAKIIEDMDINVSIIYEKSDLIKSFNIKILSISGEINVCREKIDKIRTIVNDILYVRDDYEKNLQRQTYLKYLIDSTSSKEGLPLIFIKRFIESTKDVINDLLSDVCGDSLEILDFIIDENEFSIPYMINGIKVSDISEASQGQSSVISLALSFAFMQKFMYLYNIPLLDEIDAPLYKSDREKFIAIVFKQAEAINAEQIFMISHNNTYDTYPVNVIMTTEEEIDNANPLINIMRV